jgi:hypothetical protein
MPASGSRGNGLFGRRIGTTRPLKAIQRRIGAPESIQDYPKMAYANTLTAARSTIWTGISTLQALGDL